MTWLLPFYKKKKREILKITIWISRTAGHVQRKRLEDMERRRRLISNLVCLLQANGHETRSSFICLWSFGMWIPSRKQVVLHWLSMEILQANIQNWHAQEFESTSRKACRRELRRYIPVIPPQKGLENLQHRRIHLLQQRWRIWEGKSVYVVFCSRHYRALIPSPPISASMCAIFHPGDQTSGTENNVVATCLLNLDNASRNQLLHVLWTNQPRGLE